MQYAVEKWVGSTKSVKGRCSRKVGRQYEVGKE